MVSEYLKERNILLQPAPLFFKMDFKYNLSVDSPFQEVIVMFENYKIDYKDKTIVEILYQLNYRQQEFYDKVIENDNEYQIENLDDTMLVIYVNIAKQNLLKLAYWLYVGNSMSPKFKNELERLTAKYPIK